MNAEEIRRELESAFHTMLGSAAIDGSACTVNLEYLNANSRFQTALSQLVALASADTPRSGDMINFDVAGRGVVDREALRASAGYQRQVAALRELSEHMRAPRSGDAPEIYGWAVLDKNGCTERVVSRVHYEFNCTEPVIRAGVASDLLPYLDREYKGAAPHRIVTLYTAPPADARDGEYARRYRWLREHCRFANDSDREIWFDGCIVAKDEPGILDRSIDRAMGATGGES